MMQAVNSQAHYKQWAPGAVVASVQPYAVAAWLQVSWEPSLVMALPSTPVVTAAVSALVLAMMQHGQHDCARMLR